MNDPERLVRVRAAAAVWEISHEPADVIPVLVDILEKEDAGGGAHISALNILRDIGPRAQAAIPAVKAIRDRGRPRIRSYAKSALSSIEGPPEPSMSARPSVGSTTSGAGRPGRIEVRPRSSGGPAPP